MKFNAVYYIDAGFEWSNIAFMRNDHRSLRYYCLAIFHRKLFSFQQIQNTNEDRKESLKHVAINVYSKLLKNHVRIA